MPCQVRTARIVLRSLKPSLTLAREDGKRIEAPTPLPALASASDKFGSYVRTGTAQSAADAQQASETG